MNSGQGRVAKNDDCYCSLINECPHNGGFDGAGLLDIRIVNTKPVRRLLSRRANLPLAPTISELLERLAEIKKPVPAGNKCLLFALFKYGSRICQANVLEQMALTRIGVNDNGFIGNMYMSMAIGNIYL